MSETREETLLRAGYCCQACGQSSDPARHGLGLDVHHVNRSRGDNRPENRRLLCKSCHIREHAPERTPRPKRYIVPKVANLTLEDAAAVKRLAREWGWREGAILRHAIGRFLEDPR